MGKLHVSGNQQEEGVAPLSIIPNDSWWVFVFPILITLGSTGLEVLFPNRGILCQRTQPSLVAHVTC